MGWSVSVGLALALIQSSLSVAAMRWAFRKRFFFWVWGGGVLARFLIFGITAWIVHSYTDLSLVATLISMVTATTLLLVVETSLFIKK
jgi:chromate transport protein ChrA